MNEGPISVTELNRMARTALEQAIPLLWVAGEVSNLTRAASGHVYFTLKDEGAQVRCVMFRSRAQLLPWRLENGQQVEARATVSLYEARGDYQLNVDNLRQGGLGRLYEAFARLKEKLAQEGLFAAERKRPLPPLPRAIGVVSSPQAAALRDILITLRRRAPHLPVVLYPTLVQGDGAVPRIVAAIEAAGTRRECDVLLVARGGGSIEDLWAFNDEAVARAIASCPLPVVSAVGHETDVTIADFVADLRAATPTAAAELVSAGWLAAAGDLAQLSDALSSAMERGLEERMQRLDLLAHRLVHPAQRLARNRQTLEHLRSRLSAAARQRLGEVGVRLSGLQLRLQKARPQPAAQAARLELLAQRLATAANTRITAKRHGLERLATALTALNPDATLARGYSIVRDQQGRVIVDAATLQAGDPVEMHFARGSARGRVESAS
ncbi:MAG TPA: exodeoxyribonuclease VII large subunit [Rhodocyclaceae bacterium]